MLALTKEQGARGLLSGRRQLAAQAERDALGLAAHSALGNHVPLAAGGAHGGIRDVVIAAAR